MALDDWKGPAAETHSEYARKMQHNGARRSVFGRRGTGQK
jgi:hypothetical protein